jgi:hypothetical protein
MDLHRFVLPPVRRRPRQQQRRPARYEISSRPGDGELSRIRRLHRLRKAVQPPMVVLEEEDPRLTDPEHMEELARCKKMSLTCLSKRHRTVKFQRFTNAPVLDRFLVVRRNLCIQSPRIGRSCHAEVKVGGGDRGGGVSAPCQLTRSQRRSAGVPVVLRGAGRGAA